MAAESPTASGDGAGPPGLPWGRWHVWRFDALMADPAVPSTVFGPVAEAMLRHLHTAAEEPPLLAARHVTRYILESSEVDTSLVGGLFRAQQMHERLPHLIPEAVPEGLLPQVSVAAAEGGSVLHDAIQVSSLHLQLPPKSNCKKQHTLGCPTQLFTAVAVATFDAGVAAGQLVAGQEDAVVDNVLVACEMRSADGEPVPLPWTLQIRCVPRARAV